MIGKESGRTKESEETTGRPQRGVRARAELSPRACVACVALRWPPGAGCPAWVGPVGRLLPQPPWWCTVHAVAPESAAAVL